MILDAGASERTKALVHGIGVVFAGTCAAYNTAALIHRAVKGEVESHLAINALLYWFLAAVEVSHVAHHLRERA